MDAMTDKDTLDANPAREIDRPSRDEAEEAVRRMDQDPRGLLRVVADQELGPAFLADVVSEFLVAHPGVDIDVHVRP